MVKIELGKAKRPYLSTEGEDVRLLLDGKEVGEIFWEKTKRGIIVHMAIRNNPEESGWRLWETSVHYDGKFRSNNVNPIAVIDLLKIEEVEE